MRVKLRLERLLWLAEVSLLCFSVRSVVVNDVGNTGSVDGAVATRSPKSAETLELWKSDLGGSTSTLQSIHDRRNDDKLQIHIDCACVLTKCYHDSCVGSCLDLALHI